MKIAFLTAGGLAPCLSSSFGYLIKFYTENAPDAKLTAYLHGYKGLLEGTSMNITEQVRENAQLLTRFGGSVIGNSRVKLTNKADCVKNGYITEDENPLEVAAAQLKKDGVDVLHTIGGDDTNTTAADLLNHLEKIGHKLTVVGLPKTIDNDVVPIQQTLGAWTAAEQTALFFKNIANENTTSHRQIIVHEVMGRSSGWLSAYSAKLYRDSLDEMKFLPEILLEKERWDIHAVWIPELDFDFEEEAERLGEIMDEYDCVNLFISEGAGVNEIIKLKTAAGEHIERDAHGHPRLEKVNAGAWFGKKLAKRLEAKKVLVQKSGYFARSAAPNSRDLKLIEETAKMAVETALAGESGVIGMDESLNGQLSCIDFNRIEGHKKFDTSVDWFQDLLKEIGQVSDK